MPNCLKFYINGKWVDRTERSRIDIINPASNPLEASAKPQSTNELNFLMP